MKPLTECQLYTFVDTAYLHDRAVTEIARQLCDGGSDLIQLRAKTSSPDEIRQMAEVLRPITRNAGVALVLNDHPALAKEVGADFCHLGQEDFFDAGHCQVNEVCEPGSGPRIGLSSHAPAQAKRAVEAGADYVAIGPVFATATKPTAAPVTLDYVRWAATNVRIPWFAIGGINLDTLDDVLIAGARRICVVSAILNAADIARACQEFKRRLPAQAGHPCT